MSIESSKLGGITGLAFDSISGKVAAINMRPKPRIDLIISAAAIGSFSIRATARGRTQGYPEEVSGLGRDVQREAAGGLACAEIIKHFGIGK